MTEPASPAPAPVVIQTPISQMPKISVAPLDAQDTAASTVRPAGHIALLLPLHSANFGAAAEAVRQGIMAAASLDPNAIPVQTYGDFDENSSVVAVYRQAIANGASAVIGPLTRNGVAALATLGEFPVPTLGLNILETHPARNLYFFGMAIDAEARQVALLARQHGLQRAIVISANTALARRLQFAFEEQWTASGGAILREIDYQGDPALFGNIVAGPGTMVFFAANVQESRQIRPFLPQEIPAYATSQIFEGNSDTLTNFDLEGIRFVDMPWLLQADQPAMMAYAHATPPLPTDYERLYALGIDAFQLTQRLLTNTQTLPLDGATGHIQLSDHTFNREALPALFVQGHAQSMDAPVVPTVQMFPDQLRNASSVEAAQPMSTETPAQN